jgi:hypothetical protein
MTDRIRVLYFAGENPDDVRMRWVQDKFIELYGISSSERR